MSIDPESERGELAQWLIRLRRNARLSQRNLAELAEVSLATIRDIELGKQRRPRPDTLRLLARGVATDVAGEVGDKALRRAYRILASAAGYAEMAFGREPWDETLDHAERPSWLLSPDLVGEQEARRADWDEAQVLTELLVNGFVAMPTADRKFVLNTLRALVERFGWDPTSTDPNPAPELDS